MYSTANKPRIQPTGRARLDTPQVSEAVAELSRRTEEHLLANKRITELGEAAREVCRTYQDSSNYQDPTEAELKQDAFSAALRRLGHLIDYPGWYEL